MHSSIVRTRPTALSAGGTGACANATAGRLETRRSARTGARRIVIRILHGRIRRFVTNPTLTACEDREPGFRAPPPERALRKRHQGKRDRDGHEHDARGELRSPRPGGRGERKTPRWALSWVSPCGFCVAATLIADAAAASVPSNSNP